MLSSKGYALARVAQRALKNGSSLASARCISSTPSMCRNLMRWPYDEFFGTTSNFIRNMEKEFDWLRRGIEKNLGLFNNLERNLMLGERDMAKDDMVKIDADGNRRLHVVFNLKDFQPEEIKIKTHKHNLIISAKKETKSDHDYYLREFSQSYPLPKDLKLEDLKSKWSEDGMLTIEAPLPKITEGNNKPKEKELLIEHEKKDK